MACFCVALLGIHRQLLSHNAQIKITPPLVSMQIRRGGGVVNEIMKCVSSFFFARETLGPSFFRHNKEIARGVQSLWLGYGVFFYLLQCLFYSLNTPRFLHFPLNDVY